MKRVLVLLFSAALCLGAVGAHGAYQAYISIKATKQGSLQVKSPRSKSGRVPCLSAVYNLGAGPGKGEHKPIVVIVEGIDAPQFRRAFQMHQPIDEMTVELVRPAGSGKVQLYRTIRLINAQVSKVVDLPSRHGSGKTGSMEQIQVEFTYEEISMKNVAGKTISEDDWES